MRTTLSTCILLGAALLAGCAPSMANHNAALLQPEALDTCSSAPAGEGALVVEGFGGRGEQQLIVTERQPAARCLRGAPHRTATLGPVD